MVAVEVAGRARAQDGRCGRSVRCGRAAVVAQNTTWACVLAVARPVAAMLEEQQQQKGQQQKQKRGRQGRG